MTAPDTSSAATPPAISLRQLIGLVDGPDPAIAGRVRATQLAAGRELALFLLGANLLAISVIVGMFGSSVPLPMLGGWGATVFVVAVVVTRRQRASEHRGENIAALRDLRDTWFVGAALGTVWGATPFLFDTAGGASAAYALWMVLSVLMTATALAMAPLALASTVFIGLVGSATAVRLAMEGAWVPAAATLLFTAMLIMACVARAGALVKIRAAELALSERNETVSLLLREFEDKAADWLWETDAARRVVRASPRFARALGFDPVTIDGMPFLQVLAGPTWEAGNFSAGLRQLAEKLKVRDSFRDLAVPVTVDGKERWWEIAASPRFDECGTFVGFRGVGSDVTEQRASADKINRMARFDTLTGLPNRLFVTESLQQAMAEAEKWGSRCAFMMIDLDRFKAVNDTLGHPIGDRLLSRVSARLAKLMGEHDLAGRLGGDEFAVVVRDATDTHRVERLAQRIIDVLSKPYEVDQHTLYIGASVGVATSPRDGRTAETLVRSADLALYRSKDAGGGAFHAYDPQLHVQAEERRVLEMALRTALENGEMHLAYQPVVDGITGKLSGFEALLRWTHPELGHISPAKFVPLAEETRLIGPIGEWVLRTACEEASHWPGHIRIAVNVSPEQLHNPSFTTIVASALSQSRLPPARLELEVTESVFMREGSAATRILEAVLALGVRLSLDDFGTGYSSLGYLSRTRFSTIKIDRSFVTAASKGVAEAVAIIRAVVALARSLGMVTTAEGVETDTELAMVQNFGCDKVQGFYFGRPLPVAEARALAQSTWDQSEAA